MTTSGWIWRGALALVGCIAAGYVADELVGGGAAGWSVGGVILALTCYPLFTALLAWKEKRVSR